MKTKTQTFHTWNQAHTYSSLEQSETRCGYGEKLSSEGEMFQFMCVPIFYLLFLLLLLLLYHAILFHLIFCLRLFMWFVYVHTAGVCTRSLAKRSCDLQQPPQQQQQHVVELVVTVRRDTRTVGRKRVAVAGGEEDGDIHGFTWGILIPMAFYLLSGQINAWEIFITNRHRFFSFIFFSSFWEEKTGCSEPVATS